MPLCDIPAVKNRIHLHRDISNSCLDNSTLTYINTVQTTLASAADTIVQAAPDHTDTGRAIAGLDALLHASHILCVAAVMTDSCFQKSNLG